MYLSMKLGIRLQTQFVFFPFYIPGVMSGNHRASLAGHLGLAGSVPSCLWEGVPTSIPPRQHRCLVKRGLASWRVGDGWCGSVGVQIRLGKAGTLGSDREKECVLHPEKGWWESSVGVSALWSGLWHRKWYLFTAEGQFRKLLLCPLQKQCLLIPRNLPYSLRSQPKPSQLKRPGLEYPLQTAGWEVTNCQLLAWLIQQLFEKICEQLEKLVICSLTVGPQGAIQPVTYYGELSRAIAGTFCSMLRCWQELKNGKSEQAKHVSAAWGNVRPRSLSLAAGKVMRKAGMGPPQPQRGVTHAYRLIWGLSRWAAPHWCMSVGSWVGHQPVPLGGRWPRAQTTLLLNGWHQEDVTKIKFLFQIFFWWRKEI